MAEKETCQLEKATIDPLVATSRNMIGYSSPVVAAFCKAALTHGVELVNKHLDRFVQQAWEGTNDPLKALSFRMQRIRADNVSGARGYMRGRDVYAYAVAALRNSLRKEPLKKVIQTSIDFPLPEMDKAMKRVRG